MCSTRSGAISVIENSIVAGFVVRFVSSQTQNVWCNKPQKVEALSMIALRGTVSEKNK